ncbi:ABC transporter ATP-binding protein [Gordonia rhizosphera]|uniref:Putative ABC transporter ATP-binding protein n=1 Tax=Gordonia rhizosphera NBRC 16068 TaxID=1108045 RepID=K6WCW4_9ACTN|nr:ABC transporter ATP-binding protein [Gordonia rhizosphera]GAB91581.1 putative ABC transporter ATP-binding protein [Gordonia rhizosphera NBRC 16068]
MSTAIEVRDLTKRYRHGPQALAGVSLEVRTGEIYSLLGRNGSGKTTSVRILTGLTEPTTGTVEVLGADIVTDRRRVQRQIGVTLQEAALDDVLTGREVLVMVGRLVGMSGRRARVRADELLERFGLEQVAHRQVGTYSGGTRRRLDIAASLVRVPQILFLDEPTTGLDPQSRRALWDEILRLRSCHGMTVLLTTQYLEEAQALADRIAVLHTGLVVARGTPEALRRAHGSRSLTARVGDAGGHRVAALDRLNGRAHLTDGVLTMNLPEDVAAGRIVTELEAAGIALTDLEIRRDSLEDVFLKLTATQPAVTAAQTAVST